jgi:sec-independent protein translocase protein TatA
MLANFIGPDLIIVIVVVVVLFGGSQIPKFARGVGQASKEFKKAAEDEEKKTPATPAPPAAITPPPPVAPPAAAPAEDTVTLTKAELDALLAEREAQARRDAPPGV